MKRHIIAGLAILGVAAGVGWKVSSHQESSTGLQEVSLQQGSEHSQPGPASAMARIRVRISASDPGQQASAMAGIRIRISATDPVAQARTAAHNVPAIGLAAQ